MIKYIVYIGIVLGIYACSKEETLSPSDEDKDWYAIQDEPGELEQLIYKIYKDYDCSLFYNDTLGREYRGIDGNGDSIIYYETLKIGYSINGKREINYALTDRKERILAGVKVLDEYVLPALKESKKLPRSILLVDSVYVAGRNNKAWYTESSMTALIVGLVVDDGAGSYMNIENMSEIQKMEWKGRILAVLYSAILLSESEDELEEFYNIYTNETGKKCYNWYIYESAGEAYWHPEAMGFLSWQLDEGWYRQGLTKEADCEDYISLVLGLDEEVASEIYGEWPFIMKKYQWMRSFLKKKGILK